MLLSEYLQNLGEVTFGILSSSGSHRVVSETKKIAQKTNIVKSIVLNPAIFSEIIQRCYDLVEKIKHLYFRDIEESELIFLLISLHEFQRKYQLPMYQKEIDTLFHYVLSQKLKIFSIIIGALITIQKKNG
jgi:hypothetical protein